MPRPLVVVVHGVPAPQGSKRHVGNGVLVESSAKVKPWREAVSTHAQNVMLARRLEGDAWTPGRLDPVAVGFLFTLARPSSHYRTGKHADELKPNAPEHPATRPDIDKLIRSTLDALTDAGAFGDDARVVAVMAEKVYPGAHLDALEHPGAVVTVWAV